MKVLGIMSGTSLDGMDMALVEFRGDDPSDYRLLAAETFPYTAEWEQRLRDAFHASGEELTRLDADFGVYTGRRVRDFVERTGLRPDLIASHGQTVFHEPGLGYTLQIGSGPHIAAVTGIRTVYDFRRQDVALGGQGAPLVPIGDKLLFDGYDYCLNIGGFANISYDDAQGRRTAFDTGPANMVLNRLARRLGKPYDEGGRMAASGRMITALWEALNALDYYAAGDVPKSLGREMVERDIMPLLARYETDYRTEDLLHTFARHAAWQIARAVKRPGRMLVTGGGAYNEFLVGAIAEYAPVDPVIPERELVEFKEAMIFALMGWLRVRGEVNVLASVTGACCDHSSGLVVEGIGEEID